jgi:hypothetical protein
MKNSGQKAIAGCNLRLAVGDATSSAMQKFLLKIKCETSGYPPEIALSDKKRV